jgi:hypothetical protein
MNRYGLDLVRKFPERTGVTIESTQLMVTIVWNCSGFHLICVRPSGCKSNNSYYRREREILEPLSELRREQAGGAGRRLIVHANNAGPHMHSDSITRIHGG